MKYVVPNAVPMWFRGVWTGNRIFGQKEGRREQGKWDYLIQKVESKNPKKEEVMAEKKGVSFNKREDFAEGGGLVAGKLIWHNPRFGMFDYQGKGPNTPALIVDLEPEEGDNVTQMWSVGSATDWSPDKNGKGLVPIGKATQVSKSSNFYMLIDSILNAGYPPDKFEADPSVFDGMVAEMVRVAAPERKGLKQAEKKYEAQVLLVDKILKFPWEKKERVAGAATGASTGTGSSGDGDLSEKAKSVVTEILIENPEGIGRTKLASAVFKKLQGEKLAQESINEIIKMIGGKDESFIAKNFTLKDGNVTL